VLKQPTLLRDFRHSRMSHLNEGLNATCESFMKTAKNDKKQTKMT